jgi:hypothetical protein
MYNKALLWGKNLPTKGSVVKVSSPGSRCAELPRGLLKDPAPAELAMAGGPEDRLGGDMVVRR